MAAQRRCGDGAGKGRPIRILQPDQYPVLAVAALAASTRPSCLSRASGVVGGLSPSSRATVSGSRTVEEPSCPGASSRAVIRSVQPFAAGALRSIPSPPQFVAETRDFGTAADRSSCLADRWRHAVFPGCELDPASNLDEPHPRRSDTGFQRAGPANAFLSFVFPDGIDGHRQIE